MFLSDVKKDLTQTEENAVWSQKQKLEWCGQKPRNAGSYQKLEEARRAIFPRAWAEGRVNGGGREALSAPQSQGSKTDLGLSASSTMRE